VAGNHLARNRGQEHQVTGGSGIQGEGPLLELTRSEHKFRRAVILGCRPSAIAVATALSEQGYTVHVIDESTACLDMLPQARVAEGKIVPLLSVRNIQQDLIKAEIRDANVFMAMTAVDTINILAAQMAKHMYQTPLVICKIDDPTVQSIYKDLGIIPISPTALVSQYALEAVQP